jgi:glucose/arabinose dehydrogenase
MYTRVLRVLGASLAASGLFAASATAAGSPPPPPKAANGHAVQQVAAPGVLTTPTAFAFGAGQVFVANSNGSGSAGGVYVLKNGKAVRLSGTSAPVFGLAWSDGTLYVSAAPKLLAWSGWTGSKFTSHKSIFSAGPKFTGFGGLGFGADGRLYGGVTLSATNDHSPPTTPYEYDILSMTPKGKDVTIVAKGIRQPWQMAFPTGSSSPFVTDLGQDAGVANPPDFILRVRKGQKYGFPKCNWLVMSACSAFATPFKFLPPHTDPGGLGIIGGRLYVSEFGFVHAPQVVSMPLTGGPLKPFLTGFVAPVVGLSAHAGWLYVGELTGQVFRVKP